MIEGVHTHCTRCGKLLSRKETEKSKTVIVNPCINEEIIEYLCNECKQFPSKESMFLWRNYKINCSLLNIPLTLDSVKSECMNGEWIVTVNMIMKYKGEGQLIRKGWVT